MKKLLLTRPRFGFILATRAALAFGAGLLVSKKLSRNRRRMLGKTLVGVGALTTIPAALLLRHSLQEESMPGVGKV